MRTLKIKVPDGLMEEMEAAVKAMGYSSIDELAHHAIEKSLAERREAINDAVIRQQLKGLGYLE